MPRVGVVLAAYNGADTLGRAVESVLAQTFTDWELLLIDDGSTDATPAVMAAYAKQDARIRFLRMPRNSGAPAAWNQGIRHANAPLLARLDADDWWDPDKLEVQLGAMADVPGCVLSYHTCRLWREDECVGVSAVKLSVPALEEILTWDGSVCHSSVVVDKVAFTAVGCYDESMLRGQDWDAWSKLILRSGSERVCRLAYEGCNFQLRTLSLRYYQLAERSQLRVLLRNLFARGLLLRRPRLALMMTNEYLERMVGYWHGRGVRPRALVWGLVAALATPIRRWRWRRWYSIWRNAGPTEPTG